MPKLYSPDDMITRITGLERGKGIALTSDAPKFQSRSAGSVDIRIRRSAIAGKIDRCLASRRFPVKRRTARANHKPICSLILFCSLA
jgi:hypothetical protein